MTTDEAIEFYNFRDEATGHRRRQMENKEKVELEYDFEADTRRKLEEFLKDPDKNASSIELCKKILESDMPF